jgi:hypothetical protein
MYGSKIESFGVGWVAITDAAKRDLGPHSLECGR